MDTYYKNTDEHRIDFNNVNLEHLLPQTPHKDWNLKKSQIKGYVNKLGNLTLLSKRINSSVQNLTIDKKLLELDKSELAVTKNVVERIKSIHCWNESAINQRQEEMAELGFTEIWNLSGSTKKPQNPPRNLSTPAATGAISQQSSSEGTESAERSTASESSDFVVYHNPDVMGYSATAAQPLSVVTNKPAGSALGGRVWLITGQGNPRKYYVRSWFIVDDISSGKDRGFETRLTGTTGEVYDPLIPIEMGDWWDDFRKSQGNFAFGFSPIKSSETIKHLESLIRR
ncbi:MAG: HNH endonuclease [Chloracidobacterium sp.]|nr:HNH endonuclease [Chloracidobacterium sp.]